MAKIKTLAVAAVALMLVSILAECATRHEPRNVERPEPRVERPEPRLGNRSTAPEAR